MANAPNPGAIRSLRIVRISLLFMALVWLILPIVSAPITKMSLVTASNSAVTVLDGTPTVRLGTYGYCVTLSNDPKLRCQGPMFGYDITQLTYTSDNASQVFSLDRVFSITSHTEAAAMTKAMAVMFPITLFYAVVALAVALSLKNNKTAAIVHAWCFLHTVCTLGLSLGFVNMVRNVWLIHGTENEGTSDFGKVNIYLVLAFLVQLTALCTSLTLYFVDRGQKAAYSKARTGENDDKLDLDANTKYQPQQVHGVSEEDVLKEYDYSRKNHSAV